MDGLGWFRNGFRSGLGGFRVVLDWFRRGLQRLGGFRVVSGWLRSGLGVV